MKLLQKFSDFNGAEVSFPATMQGEGLSIYYRHKLRRLDPSIRSVSRVTAALANFSSVFQLFFFPVVCSGMISLGQL
jgi:hypothetical protein